MEGGDFEEETNKRERDGHPLSRIADTHGSFSLRKGQSKGPKHGQDQSGQCGVVKVSNLQRYSD